MAPTGENDFQSFLLAVKFDVNDGRCNLLHHIGNEVVLVAETVRVLLSCRYWVD